MTDFYYTGKNSKNDKSLKNKFHGFFTRNGGISQNNFFSLNCAFNDKENNDNVIKNRKIVCNKISKSTSELVLINQIHSNKVIEINHKNKTKQMVGDGLITREKNLFLGILTADCAPIIFLGKNYVGIIHVGWRGLLNGIIEKTIDLLKTKGEKNKELSCIVGPHLESKNFQVKEDFKNTLLENNKNNVNFLKYKNGKQIFEFSMFIRYKLSQYNLSCISFINLDTYSNPTLFFSHRYSKQRGVNDCGRQISVVGILKTKKINN
ncbi:peptidoglycan editing factor PgeF [Rickettsiales bacterium]|nr:peptidoglycan editing factor PgeF [Rickettsiales bacterium]